MAHRAMVVASVVVVAMGAYVFMGYINRPAWSTVYRAEDATSLTQAIEDLNGAGIQNQVDGNTISVPRAQLTAARSALASDTAVSGSNSCQGYELLDSSSLSMSNDVQ